MSECLTCGSKEVSNTSVRYFCVPGMVMVPNSYLLCEQHKGLQYSYEDIYEEDGTRKKIDHQSVIERTKK